MKFILFGLLVLSAFIVLTSANKGGRGGRGRERGGHGHGNGHGKGHGSDSSQSHEDNQDMIEIVNKTIMVITSSKKDGGTFIWDLLPSFLRYFLLNQAKFQSEAWNVDTLVKSKTTNLLWSEIPVDVKTQLLDEYKTHKFLDITFLEWNIAKIASDIYANTTFRQLLKQKTLNLLPSLYLLTDQISFDTAVDLDLVKSKLTPPEPAPVQFKASGSRLFYGKDHKNKNKSKQTKVCVWKTVLGLDYLTGQPDNMNFDQIFISLLSKANMRPMYLMKMINQFQIQKDALKAIYDSCSTIVVPSTAAPSVH